MFGVCFVWCDVVVFVLCRRVSFRCASLCCVCVFFACVLCCCVLCFGLLWVVASVLLCLFGVLRCGMCVLFGVVLVRVCVVVWWCVSGCFFCFVSCMVRGLCCCVMLCCGVLLCVVAFGGFVLMWLIVVCVLLFGVLLY